MTEDFLQKYLLNGSQDWVITKNTLRKMKRVISRYSNPENRKGRLGEIYVADNLNHQLQMRGLKPSYKTKPLTYNMRFQYRGYKHRGRGGCDILLKMTDANNKSYRSIIEISNWMRMHTINDYILDTRITSKYRKYDVLNRCNHIVCMNKRNIPLIQDRCDGLGIIIIPLQQHITPEFIQRLEEKNMIVDDYTNCL